MEKHPKNSTSPTHQDTRSQRWHSADYKGCISVTRCCAQGKRYRWLLAIHLFLIIKGSAILGKVNMRKMQDDTHLTGRWASYQYRKVTAGTAAAFSCVTHAAANDERNPQNASRFFFFLSLHLLISTCRKVQLPLFLMLFSALPSCPFILENSHTLLG